MSLRKTHLNPETEANSWKIRRTSSVKHSNALPAILSADLSVNTVWSTTRKALRTEATSWPCSSVIWNMSGRFVKSVTVCPVATASYAIWRSWMTTAPNGPRWLTQIRIGAGDSFRPCFTKCLRNSGISLSAAGAKSAFASRTSSFCWIPR